MATVFDVYNTGLNSSPTRQAAAPGESWANIRTGVGTHISGLNWVYCTSSLATDLYDALRRYILVFDTSSLAGETVTNATLSLYVQYKWDLLGAPSLGLYTATPTDPENIVAADFGDVGSSLIADAIAYGDIVTGATNSITLNIAAINTSGYTCVGLRMHNFDTIGTSPTWVSGSYSGITFVPGSTTLLVATAGGAFSHGYIFG